MFKDISMRRGALALTIFNSWLFINRVTTDSFINGYGLFQDIWAPIVEAIINFSVAVILGRFYGISGVLMGTILSTLIIIYLWKPYLLFTKGFQRPALKSYFVRAIGRWTIACCNIALFVILNRWLAPRKFTSFLQIFLYAIVLSSTILPVVYGSFYILTSGTRRFHHRILSLIFRKL